MFKGKLKFIVIKGEIGLLGINGNWIINRRRLGN